MHPEDWRAVGRLLVVGGNPQPAEVLSLHAALSFVRRALPEVDLTVLTVETLDLEALQAMQIEAIALVDRERSDQDLQPTDSSAYNTPLDQGSRADLMQQAKPLIQHLGDRRFDAALIFTTPTQSPYAWAYLCYLAGIPIRIGQSQEFGGRVLSTWVSPPLEEVSTTEYYLHLLQSIRLTATQKSQPQLVV
ncbi:MAG: hypothetical protein SFY66_18330 [Oculatellaceae cyanobacterium bins.114]|nr:hypothetical protein [Oculatellaceae cyanobacterium bins.114]